MQYNKNIYSPKAGLLVVGLFTLVFSGTFAKAAAPTSIPPGTTLPIRFSHPVDTKKVHQGDLVIARTMQVVVLPDGQQLPKGAVVKGHVVAVRPYGGRAANAESRASLLTIHFDEIEAATVALPVNLSVRAMANSLDSEDASTPHGIDETDHLGNLTLIGGGEFSPLDRVIRDNGGDIIGYNRKEALRRNL